MNRVTRLAVLLCVVVLLAAACAPSQAPAPSAVPSHTALAAAATRAPSTPTEGATGVLATDTPPPATPLPPEALPTDTAMPPSPAPAPELTISSAAFAPGEEIPVRHSCFAENLSPPLAWSGLPEGTVSLALVVDDPDSQPPGFVHWVVYNLPATTFGLPEGVPTQGELDDGTLQGTNGFAPFEGQTFPSGATINGVGYAGPCPPGRHHYVLTLYALDTVLELAAQATADQILTAMQGHILTQALLVGVFTPPQ